MKYSFVIVLIIAFAPSFLFSQEIVELADNTFKINGFAEAQFYFGFAQGDKLVFSFEEVNGKEISELEVVELPSSSKFTDCKIKKIESKTLNVPRTAIYKFQLKNNSMKQTGRAGQR